jgi:putative chitinase
MLTERQLQGIMRRATAHDVALWTSAFRDAMAEYGINTKGRAAGFLASVANESGELTRFEEMGYAGTPNDRIALIFGPRAPAAAELALWKTMGRQAFDEAFFNHVYDDRRVNIGLGNDRDGDGYRFRGLGPLQLTGKANAHWIGGLIGIDLVAHPEKLLEPETGARAAAAYWQAVGNNGRMDAGDFLGAMRKMNPGLPSFAPHLVHYRRAVDVLSQEVKETPSTPTEAAAQVATGKTGAALGAGVVAGGALAADAVTRIGEATAAVTAGKGFFAALGISPEIAQLAIGAIIVGIIGFVAWRYGRKLLRGEAVSS